MTIDNASQRSRVGVGMNWSAGLLGGGVQSVKRSERSNGLDTSYNGHAYSITWFDVVMKRTDCIRQRRHNVRF